MKGQDNDKSPMIPQISQPFPCYRAMVLVCRNEPGDNVLHFCVWVQHQDAQGSPVRHTLWHHCHPVGNPQLWLIWDPNMGILPNPNSLEIAENGQMMSRFEIVIPNIIN